MGQTIQVPGTFENIIDGKLANAEQIYDATEGKSQSAINAKVKEDVEAAEGDISNLQTAVADTYNKSAIDTALSAKQDSISDLATIRSGASAGATAVQPADMTSALADKQDTIADLATIRSGASAGATAVQPADMTSALADKQDTIADLATIRSGASAGATAVQPADMTSALADKQDTIADLATIRSGASAGATAVQPADMTSALADKQDTIVDLATIRSGASAGATAVQPADMTSALADKQDTIADLDTIRSGAALGATAKQPATTLAGYGITDAYTKAEVNNLVSTTHQQYVTVATKADLDAITIGSADTIYRVSNYDGTQVDATKYAEYAWDGTQYMLLSVKSAVGEVFDVSEYNSGATYETLAAALAAVPESVQRGGMSIKFVQSSDNKYVQYFLTKNVWSASEADWDKMNLEEEVSQLGQKALVPDIEILTGGYIGQGGDFNVFTKDTACYTDFIPLADDLLFFYTGRARYAVCQWAFYDKNKVFISSHGVGTDADNVKVENIPSNAFYIRFSSIYTQMVVWVVSKEKLYSLHLENTAAIAANSNAIATNSNAIKILSNLISVPNYDNNGYYNVGSGNYSAFNDAKAISDYYPIADSIDYVITGYSHYSAALFVIYDEQKNVLGTYPATGDKGITTTNKSFRELMSIPSNAKYIRFSTLFPATADYGLKIYFRTNPNVKLWSGKKWAVVGDSLTEHNSRALKNYHDFVAEETGISVLNYGSSGTGYAKDKNTNSAFFQRINSIPTDIDVITIFGSGNDLGFLPLGTITDSDTTTLCGCINATIDAVLARFPMTPFGIITPTPWFDSWTPESAPNTMSDYADAIAEICKKKGIPCLNLFYCSNLHPEIPAIRAIEYKRDGTYVASTEGTPNAIQVTSDLLEYVQNNGVSDAQVGDWVLGTLNGVHPDEDGHKLFAPRIEAFLKTLLLN